MSLRGVLLPSAQVLPEADWQDLETNDDPFVTSAFLSAAEPSGVAAEPSGWRPMHLALRDDEDNLAGLLPLYLRHHSFGDFSHDWHWASAWRQAGLDYYPKLVTGVPFTPSPGPRLLTRAGEATSTGPVLISAALEWAAELGVSSWQCLFVCESDRELLASAGLMLRRGVQFHWINQGYRDFSDFLEGFTAEKRKKVKRERRAVREAGLRVEVRHGDEIDAPLWMAIHRHYRDTFRRYGNHPAFSLDFFRGVGKALKQRMVVFIACQGDKPVASAICYRNHTTLFGRHWGTDVDCPGLHFELCFYSGIEYAIAHGLQRFEPGAQGEHKLARGFEPAPTWSAFWIADGRMRHAVANFLARESETVQAYHTEMAEHLPYKSLKT